MAPGLQEATKSTAKAPAGRKEATKGRREPFDLTAQVLNLDLGPLGTIL